jgi:hypothetical protein
MKGWTTEKLVQAVIASAKSITPRERARVRARLYLEFGKPVSRKDWVN